MLEKTQKLLQRKEIPFISVRFYWQGQVKCLVRFFFFFFNEAEMKNVCYLFNNSYICSVLCLFPCVLVLLTWICRGGRNCCILRTVAKEWRIRRGRKRGKELLFVYFLVKLLLNWIIYICHFSTRSSCKKPHFEGFCVITIISILTLCTTQAKSMCTYNLKYWLTL